MFEKTYSFLRWFFGFSKKEISLPPPVMSITAIIPAYNEARYIADTVRALQLQTYPLDEIIVIDDCSTDGTGDIARALGVTVVRTPKNQGSKAQAQSFGMRGLQTELFVTVDADTVLAPDALYEAMRCFNDPRTEVVCGTVVPQKLKTFWELGRHVEYLYAQFIMKPAQNHNGLVLVASGCFSIFRTKTALGLGGFNERTMAEDMDLTWMIQETGGRVYFASKALCYPVDPSTFSVYVSQIDRWYRGFMQNVKVRNYKLFPGKKSMGVMVYAYLVWFGLSALVTPALVGFMMWNYFGGQLSSVVDDSVQARLSVLLAWSIVFFALALFHRALPSVTKEYSLRFTAVAFLLATVALSPSVAPIAALASPLVPPLVLAVLTVVGVLVGSFVTQLVIVLSLAVIAGIRIGRWKEAIKGYPAFFVMQYINIYIYIRAAWRELVLGQKLNYWTKGH